MRSPAKLFVAVMLATSLAFAPAFASPQQQDQKQKPKDKKSDVEQIGNRNVGGGLNLYSLEKEMAMGKYYANEIERTAKLVDDPVVAEYVNRVGQNLVKNSDAKVPFTIKVIDSDELNAFALPGGFFYVNSGLILAADEEAEMAGVMAHEIAHVTARHVTKNMTKAEIANWAMLPLLIFGPAGWTGYGIYQASNFLIPMTFLKFSRDAEREADFLGLQYMYAAGYDPNAYVSFFEKIRAQEKRSPGSIPKVFASHPPTPERIQNTQKEIAQILPTRNEYVVSTSEFDLVKQRLRSVLAGSKAKDDEPGKPTLRKRTEQDTDKDKKSKDKEQKTTDDDRPVLKRRP
ncbi:MAG: M48 family metallopeptidase [Acidobacteria bacterium]|nr:M48 family metallopeptidase [Acidobacteriota bacterium]MCL5288860.1 M48 family metallopeptidase [Acidobacteriota bacterium]